MDETKEEDDTAGIPLHFRFADEKQARKDDNTIYKF